MEHMEIINLQTHTFQIVMNQKVSRIFQETFPASWHTYHTQSHWEELIYQPRHGKERSRTRRSAFIKRRCRLHIVILRYTRMHSVADILGLV